MDPATWAALAVAAGGTAVSANAQRQQRKEQRQILNRQLDTTAKTSDNAAELIKDEAKKYQGDARMDAMTAAENAAYTQSQSDLQGAGAGIIDGAGDTGNVSADYVKAKSDKAITEGNRLTTLARELARVRAPTELLNSEGIRRASLAGDLNNRWSATRNLTNAGAMDAQNVEEPWWGNVGRAAQSYGMSSAGSSIGANAGGTAEVIGNNPSAYVPAQKAGGWWSGAGRYRSQ